jgi:hypothetical protein
MPAGLLPDLIGVRFRRELLYRCGVSPECLLDFWLSTRQLLFEK